VRRRGAANRRSTTSFAVELPLARRGERHAHGLGTARAADGGHSSSGGGRTGEQTEARSRRAKVGEGGWKLKGGGEPGQEQNKQRYESSHRVLGEGAQYERETSTGMGPRGPLRSCLWPLSGAFQWETTQGGREASGGGSMEAAAGSGVRVGVVVCGASRAQAQAQVQTHTRSLGVVQCLEQAVGQVGPVDEVVCRVGASGVVLQ